MKILFTICGRAGSKGLASKNIKEFCGHPLPLYTLSVIDLFAKETNHDITIALNTDSQELKNIFKRFTSVLQIEREPEQATDTAGKLAVIKDTYIKSSKQLGCDFDYIIDLDITSPLRTVADIQNLIMEKEKNPSFDVVFSVVKSRRNPYFNMVELVGGKAQLVKESKFTARQQTPQVYDMNASMYLYDPKFLSNKNRIFDGECGVVEMQDFHVLDIDSEDDFIWMEYIYEKLVIHNSSLQGVQYNIKTILI